MARHRLVVLLNSGERIESPKFEDRGTAEAELNALRSEMGSNSRTDRSWLALENALRSIKAAWIVELAPHER